MKIQEFYQWYANLPLEKRLTNIGTFADETFPLILNDVYEKLRKLEDITRPYDIEREKLLSKVSWWKLQEEATLISSKNVRF